MGYPHHGCARGPADLGDVQVALVRVRGGMPPPKLDVQARLLVVVTLTQAGWSAARISRGLGLAWRSTQRLRNKARQLGLLPPTEEQHDPPSAHQR